MHVSSILPVTQTSASATVLTVTGSNFISTSWCSIGTELATAVTVVSDSLILCLSPAQHANSLVAVEVSNNLQDFTDDRQLLYFYRTFR